MEYTSKAVDHLGIVVGVCKEIELVEGAECRIQTRLSAVGVG